MTKKIPTRDRFLEAARFLFWQRGYRAVSVDDICTRAHGLKGSFYHFFPSKEQLLVEVLKEVWKEERAALEAIRALPVPMLERLHRYVDRYVQVQRASYREHGEIFGSFYLALNAGLPAEGLQQVRLMAYDFKVALSEMFTVLADEGLMDHASVPLKVRAFNYFMSGAHMDARIMGSLDPLDNLADQTLRLLGLPAVNCQKPERDAPVGVARVAGAA